MMNFRLTNKNIERRVSLMVYMKRVMHIALHERAIKDEDRSLKKIQNYRPGKEYKEIQAGFARKKNDV